MIVNHGRDGMNGKCEWLRATDAAFCRLERLHKDEIRKSGNIKEHGFKSVNQIPFVETTLPFLPLFPWLVSSVQRVCDYSIPAFTLRPVESRIRHSYKFRQ